MASISGLRISVRLRLWLAQNRTPITAIAAAASAFALAWYFQLGPQASARQKWMSLGLFVISNVVTVLLSIAPQYYERIRYVTSLLPAIYQALELDESSRVAIHHIRSTRSQTYEQLTPYYPTSTGQGRLFRFSQGITAQTFRTRQSQAYRIPDTSSLAENYKDRWSFTNDEISRLTQDRRSFYAFPIGQDGGFAKAVLYFDSAEPSTFDPGKKQLLDDQIERLFLPILERLLGTDERTSPQS